MQVCPTRNAPKPQQDIYSPPMMCLMWSEGQATDTIKTQFPGLCLRTSCRMLASTPLVPSDESQPGSTMAGRGLLTLPVGAGKAPRRANICLGGGFLSSFVKEELEISISRSKCVLHHVCPSEVPAASQHQASVSLGPSEVRVTEGLPHPSPDNSELRDSEGPHTA